MLDALSRDVRCLTSCLLGRDATRALDRLLLGLTPLGEIARDLAEANELALAVAQGRDDDVRPELGAVLANAPPLVLEPAGACRFLQFIFGEADVDLLLWVEDGKVLSDDVVGRVLL